MSEPSRLESSEEVYRRLFGERDTTAPDPDPELGRILRTVIFGDVFAIGDLDDQTRELVTVTVLATLQTLPQLKAHCAAALRVGVTPVQLREAVYQLAPIVGFPRTLNAVGVVDEVLTAQGVQLPLPDQGQVDDADRNARGREIQHHHYGDRMAQSLATLPDGYGETTAELLTGLLFGDFYTRSGLDLALRELLVLVSLATLGLEPQLRSHVRGVLRAGNSPERVIAALIQGFPYMGFPCAVNAIRYLAEALAEQQGQDEQQGEPGA